MVNLVISTFDGGLKHEAKYIARALRLVVSKIRAQAKVEITSGSRSGVMYGKHKASAPGEAPARDKGVLGKKFSVSVKTKTMTARIWDNDWIALPLEAGAEGGGRGKGGKSGKSLRLAKGRRQATTNRFMAPRPYLSEALKHVPAQDIMTKALNDGFVTTKKRGRPKKATP